MPEDIPFTLYVVVLEAVLEAAANATDRSSSAPCPLLGVSAMAGAATIGFIVKVPDREVMVGVITMFRTRATSRFSVQ